jgi:hypothetical protein
MVFLLLVAVLLVTVLVAQVNWLLTVVDTGTTIAEAVLAGKIEIDL